MKTNDILTRDELRGIMQKAIKENDTEGFYKAFDQMIDCIGEEIQQKYDAQIENYKAQQDISVLAQRGVRQLTSKERDYYQRLSEATRSPNPKQALADAALVLPRTVIDAVFDELQTNHPLLSRVGFVPATGLTEVIMNKNGYEAAVWGKLCDEVIKELTSGFVTVNTTLLKLSAFIPVCKAMLELGPEWM